MLVEYCTALTPAPPANAGACQQGWIIVTLTTSGLRVTTVNSFACFGDYKWLHVTTADTFKYLLILRREREKVSAVVTRSPVVVRPFLRPACRLSLLIVAVRRYSVHRSPPSKSASQCTLSGQSSFCGTCHSFNYRRHGDEIGEL